MASDTKNVKLGVCSVIYDNQDLGYTQGGVEVSVTTDTHDVNIDQFGKTPINQYIEGRTCNVKVPLAETTLRNLVKIMPGATLVTDGVLAKGALTFTAQPAATASLSIAGKTFTFVAGSPTTVFEVARGATQAVAQANLAAAINLANIGVIATVVGAVINVVASDPGVAGNAIATTVGGGAALGATFGGATLTGGVAETRARVDVSSGIGNDLLKLSKQLRLHPVGKDATDLSDDFVIPLAGTAGALTFAYKTDAERVFNTEFNAYPDPVTGKLFSVGDPLAGQ